MQQDVLNVFLNESQVGTLLQENGALSFKYAPEYLQNKEAYPLSQNLPLTDGIFHDPVVENFFSNLLPDERIRTTVAMILRVSPENTFGLLKHIGADCAGAVSFYPGPFFYFPEKFSPPQNGEFFESQKEEHFHFSKNSPGET